MPDPRTEQFSNAYAGIRNPEDREKFKQAYAEEILKSQPTVVASQALIDASNAIGEDLTQYLFRGPELPPTPGGEERDLIQQATSKTPWYRRGLNNAVAAAEWWQENVTEPSAATVLGNIFQLVPGQQEFERNLIQVRREQTAERILERKEFDVGNYLSEMREAYRRTDMPWGTKGFSELVFDPLNLVGLGIPAKVGKALPALRPLMTPLQAIDNVPNVIAKKALEVPFKGVKVSDELATTLGLDKSLVGKGLPGLLDVPGISALGQPHWTSQVRDTFRKSFASVREAFGPTFDSGDIQDTVRVLSDQSRWPEATGPFSLRNMMNHVGESFDSVDKWEKFHEQLMNKTPQEAASWIAGFVAKTERDALTKGGARLTGEVIEEGISARRVRQVTSVLERMTLDRKHAEGVAEGIEKYLFGKLANTYLRKIEPSLVRPWAVAHLAFAGYMPMNIMEDVGMATLGMNSIGKTGLTDTEAVQHFNDLVGDAAMPTHLLQAEKNGRDMLDIMMGVYERNTNTPMEQVANFMGGWAVRLSSKWGWAIRRASWINRFGKELDTALREAGVDPGQINALREIVRTDFPEGLEHLRDDIQTKVWQVVSTGKPEALRDLRHLMTNARLIQRAQATLASEFPNTPFDARRVFFHTVFKDGGITPDNLDAVYSQMEQKLLDWHKFDGNSIKAELGGFIDALGFHEPASAAEASALLRSLQHLSDTVANLPHEIRAHARVQANRSLPAERQAVWDESLRVIDEDLSVVRAGYGRALERARPHLDKYLPNLAETEVERQAISRSVDQIFDAYRSIGDDLVETWRNYRSRVQQHFNDVDPADRDSVFWQELHTFGEEIWSAHRLLRAEQANIARTGWNAFMDSLPSDLVQRDRQFVKAGLESSLNDAEQRLNELRHMLDQTEASMASAPETLGEEYIKRIDRIRRAIAIAEESRRALDTRLQQVERELKVVPHTIAEWDTDISSIRAAIREAQQSAPEQVPEWEQMLSEALSERQAALDAFVPSWAKQHWENLKLGTGAEADLALRNFEDNVVSGNHNRLLETVTGLNRSQVDEAARKVLADAGGVPATLDDAREILERLYVDGDNALLEVAANASGDSGERVLEQLYARMVQFAEAPELTPNQLNTLRTASQKELFPTRALGELIDAGYLKTVVRLSDGRLRTELTEKGDLALRATADEAIDVDELLASLPPAEREIRSVLDTHLEDVSTLLDRSVKEWENPPLGVGAEERLSTYFDRIAGEMERRPDFLSTMREARQVAGVRTNAAYSDWFINYDNRNNLDFFMQRLMPFWMYESRRWPRLIKLAAKRPVLAKYFTMMAGEWDYGYQPAPLGFEFHPAKGTIAFGIRRTLSRDFPEMHQGDWRGKVENTFDQLARGGFYFSPPITAAMDIVSGEPANTLPAPVSLVIHGLAATTGLPAGIEDIAFNSRYMDFLLDQQLADSFGPPGDIRRLAEAGDEQAQARIAVARRKVAARYIAMQQLSVLRYRPAGKRQFTEDNRTAVEEVLGIDQQTQEVLRRLGVSPYELIPVSRFQRQAMREMVPNYDAWIGASMAFRPIEEQRMARTIDAFWADMEQAQVAFEADVNDLSRRWEDGLISGPDARDQYKQLQGQRAAVYERLKARPEYQSVPVTMEERKEYAARFNKPPQMVSPVDEALEHYYGIRPDGVDANGQPFTNAVTQETDWQRFFAARQAYLDALQPEIAMQVRDSVRKANTPLERTMELSAPYLQAYYGIRQQLIDQMGDPVLTTAYSTYRRLQNQSALAFSPEEAARFRQQAIDLSSRNPNIAILEAQVKDWRKNFRETDPNMEAVYRMFIASPGAITSGTGRGGLRGLSARGGLRGIR